MATRSEIARKARSEKGTTAAARAEDVAEGLGLAIDHRPIGSLIPYVRNARTHSERQVALIAGSIREFGFVNPVLVDGENGVIAGHGRLLVARKLGLATVPVIELGHLGEAQKRAYVLADNKLAERAGWDLEMLALEAGELTALGADLEGLGFEAGEIDDLLHRGAADPRETDIGMSPKTQIAPPPLHLIPQHPRSCARRLHVEKQPSPIAMSSWLGRLHLLSAQSHFVPTFVPTLITD